MAQVFAAIPCSVAAARDWHRHRTWYPWEMFLRADHHTFRLHESYEPISEGGKEAMEAYFSYAKGVYDSFMEQVKPNMAMLAMPLGTAVTMEAAAGLRDAIYALELRSGAKGTATAEYNPQAKALLRMLVGLLTGQAGPEVVDELNLRQHVEEPS